MEGVDARFQTETYDYHLPRELIAQEPLPQRERSRMMVLSANGRAITHASFCDLRGYLHDGDLLVVNNSRVFPARLMGRKESGGKIELLLLQPSREADVGDTFSGPDFSDHSEWNCFVRASRRPAPGQRVELPGGPAPRSRAH